jgi:co-chaperonin GroES (HSP10)
MDRPTGPHGPSSAATGASLSSSRIAVPGSGAIVAVGPGGRNEAGDRVLFGKWSGTEVKIDGVEYLIMKESDIMGVLLETEARRKAA